MTHRPDPNYLPLWARLLLCVLGAPVALYIAGKFILLLFPELIFLLLLLL